MEMSSRKSGVAPNMSVTVVGLAPREVGFRYEGEICDAGIKLLVDKIEYAFDRYAPQSMTLVLNSPGGAVTALEYWLHKANQWRARGVPLKVRADMLCASAAGIMLALGAVGQREVHPLTKLVYHNPRYMFSSGPLLEHDAERTFSTLKESRERMHALLRSELIGNLGRKGLAATLVARARWLESDANAQEAAQLMRYNPAAEHLDAIEDLASEWAGVDEMCEESANEILHAWSDELERLFRRDCVVDLRAAWLLMLFDKTECLPGVLLRCPETLEPNVPREIPPRVGMAATA